MTGTLLNRSNCVLPFETLINRITFQIVATGQPEKAWVEICHFLHQIDAIAIRTIMIRRREQ